jgi:hypothetical protein
VLFGQHGADEADQGAPVGEYPDDVGAASDLLVQPFLGVVRLMRVILVKGAGS